MSSSRKRKGQDVAANASLSEGEMSGADDDDGWVRVRAEEQTAVADTDRPPCPALLTLRRTTKSTLTAWKAAALPSRTAKRRALEQPGA